MKTSLVNVAVSMLQDASWYLERICDTAYIQPLPRLSGATVGQHTRHIAGHFQGLNYAMRAARTEENVILNYDAHLSYIAIETSPRVALAAIDDIINMLPRSVSNRIFGLENTSISSEDPILVPTTCERELLCSIEHTLHHFELIKIGLNIVSPCLELPAHFGIAPLAMESSKASMPLCRTFSLAQLDERRVAV